MVTTGPEKVRSYDGDYKEEGNKAEEIVLKFLRDCPWVIGVDDWRNLRAVQEADVDCAIKTRDGRVTLAEIKSDKHLGVSGNVLFEMLRINHTCVPDKAGYLGWSFRSPATYFLYYAPSAKSLYQCRADALREVAQQYTRQKRKGSRVDWVNTGAIKSTINLLIPWEFCKDIFTVHDVSKYCSIAAVDRLPDPLMMKRMDDMNADHERAMAEKNGHRPQQAFFEL